MKDSLIFSDLTACLDCLSLVSIEIFLLNAGGLSYEEDKDVAVLYEIFLHF